MYLYIHIYILYMYIFMDAKIYLKKYNLTSKNDQYNVIYFYLIM